MFLQENIHCAKNVLKKGVDDKRRITATFAVSFKWKILAHSIDLQRENQAAPNQSLNFPATFSLSYTENHWSNTEKSIEFFEQIIFPYLRMVKRENRYPEEQYALIIMDTFKGQDNE